VLDRLEVVGVVLDQEHDGTDIGKIADNEVISEVSLPAYAILSTLEMYRNKP
jgi:hypothetical protein